MLRRYAEAMRLAFLFLLMTAPAAAQERGASAPPESGGATATATASAAILPRSVRIIASAMRARPGHLPPQASLSTQPCPRGAAPDCRALIVIDMP